MGKTHFLTPAGSGNEFAHLLSLYMFGAPLGNVYFVNSVIGADTTGRGFSPESPLATIDYAVGLCSANNHDFIVALPGHAETVSGAAGINVDVAGVTILGIGKGTARPTITMSAVASTFVLAAANCHVENLFFNVQHDTTIVIDVNASDCTVKNCEIRSRTASTAREFVTAIDINGGAANACDRTRIEGCLIYSPTAGAANGIELGEVADCVEIVGCQVWGDYSDACIHNPTGKVLTRLTIRDCILENTQTGDHAIELVSACTGILARNLYKSDMTQATACDPGSCFSYECYHDDVIDTSAIICPAVT